MEQLLLKNMLFASSFVMFAYGLFSFFTISPKGEEYHSYRVSRKIFGIMMFVIAACLLVHWQFDLRHENKLLASSLCLLYTTSGAMVLSVIFTSLIKGEYPFRKRLKEIAFSNICLVAVLVINYLFIPRKLQYFVLIVAAIFFVVIVFVSTLRFFRSYRETINLTDNYYSDNIGKTLQWIPTTIYSIILLVLVTAILSVVSNVSFISVDLFLGLSIITYVFLSLQNYMINTAKLKILLLDGKQVEIAEDNSEQITSEIIEVESRESKAVRLKLDKWIEGKGFAKQGLTLDDLARELNTNRTYLSSYINSFYNLTFRGWIALQRIEYSKELLLQDQELSVATVAEMVGYSQNAFIKIFAKEVGVSPMQWRKGNKI